MNDRNGYSTAYPDRLCEWLFSCMMLAWGAWLLFPGWRTFDAPQYALLAKLADEAVWGVWSVAIGAIRCAALYVNGAHRRTPLIRAVCASLGMLWWIVLGFLFLATPEAKPLAGFSWYPLFIGFEMICIWRSAADGYHSHAFRIRAANSR